MFRKIPRRRKLLFGAKSAGQNGIPQPKIHLPEEWAASFRKWYCEYHIKWIFKNTIARCILNSEGFERTPTNRKHFLRGPRHLLEN